MDSLGAGAGETDLVGAHLEALGDHGTRIVEQQPSLPARPVESPRIGVPSVEGRQEHIAGGGVERLGRGGVEVGPGARTGLNGGVRHRPNVLGAPEEERPCDRIV